MKKSKALREKVVSLDDAIKLLNDDDFVALGGCQIARAPTKLIYGVIKARKKGLTISRGLISMEGEWLYVAGAIKKMVTSWYGYSINLGRSNVLGQAVSDKILALEEWSNYTLGLRLRAGAMGIPFIPTKSLIGSDLIKNNGAKMINCPFTAEKLCIIPALNPDVALIHVQMADCFGNAQIEGPTFYDSDIALASRKVIISAERIVDKEIIKKEPSKTNIPFFCVDAVVEAKLGAYPMDCCGVNDPDYEFFRKFSEISKAGGREAVSEFIDRNFYQTSSFEEFLAKKGEFN